MRKKTFGRILNAKTLKVTVNDRSYEVEVRYSKVRRSISLRLSKTGFVCNAPIFITEKEISDFIVRSIPKLEKRAVPKPSPINGDKVWILGEEKEIPGFQNLTKQKQNSLLKSYLLPLLEELNEVHRVSMGIERRYEIKVRSCKSVFGVNHRSEGFITYALELVHFRKEVIESVVCHELAHHFVLGHGQKFYRILLRECPTYWDSRKKLIKHIYD